MTHVTLVQKQVLRLITQHGAMCHRPEVWTIGEGLQKLTDMMRESLLAAGLVERIGDELVLTELGQSAIPRSPGIVPPAPKKDRDELASIGRDLSSAVRVNGRTTDVYAHGTHGYIQFGYHPKVFLMCIKRGARARNMGYLSEKYELTDSGRTLAALHGPAEEPLSTGPQTADDIG